MRTLTDFLNGQMFLQTHFNKRAYANINFPFNSKSL